MFALLFGAEHCWWLFLFAASESVDSIFSLRVLRGGVSLIFDWCSFVCCFFVVVVGVRFRFGCVIFFLLHSWLFATLFFRFFFHSFLISHQIIWNQCRSQSVSVHKLTDFKVKKTPTYISPLPAAAATAISFTKKLDNKIQTRNKLISLMKVIVKR